MGIKFWAHISIFVKHICFLFDIRDTPNHIQLEYRCHNEESKWIKIIYLGHIPDHHKHFYIDLTYHRLLSMSWRIYVGWMWGMRICDYSLSPSFLLLGWTLLSQMFITTYLGWFDVMHIIVQNYMTLQNRKIGEVCKTIHFTM